MEMVKKILAASFAVVIACSALTACGGSTENDNVNAKAAAVEPAQENTEEEAGSSTLSVQTPSTDTLVTLKSKDGKEFNITKSTDIKTVMDDTGLTVSAGYIDDDNFCGRNYEWPSSEGYSTSVIIELADKSGNIVPVEFEAGADETMQQVKALDYSNGYTIHGIRVTANDSGIGYNPDSMGLDFNGIGPGYRFTTVRAKLGDGTVNDLSEDGFGHIEYDMGGSVMSVSFIDYKASEITVTAK